MSDETRITEGTIDSAFKPGVVKISCGCSPERALHCFQRGQARGEDGKLHASSPLNKQCHIFVDELDLINMAYDVTVARFQETRRCENPYVTEPGKNPFRDDSPDLPQPVQPKRSPRRPRRPSKKLAKSTRKR